MTMHNENCRNVEHYRHGGNPGTGDQIIVHVHDSPQVGSLGEGDFVVHGGDKNGMWLGVKKRNGGLYWVHVSQEQAVDIAAAIMYANQPETWER